MNAVPFPVLRSRWNKGLLMPATQRLLVSMMNARRSPVYYNGCQRKLLGEDVAFEGGGVAEAQSSIFDIKDYRKGCHSTICCFEIIMGSGKEVEESKRTLGRFCQSRGMYATEEEALAKWSGAWLLWLVLLFIQSVSICSVAKSLKRRPNGCELLRRECLQPCRRQRLGARGILFPLQRVTGDTGNVILQLWSVVRLESSW